MGDDKRDMPWVDYDPAQPPPHPEAVVMVRFRDGVESRGRRSGTLHWQHKGHGNDIVAYKIIGDY